jgi:hypothetical protein
MIDTTIIYYTANQEDESFESKVRDNILKQKGNLPLISVSRKPIDFGQNICVGEIPVCYSNSFKQLLLGLSAAKTTYCLATESDYLYPPEYFTFHPPTADNVYRYLNLWIYFITRKKAWRKPYVEAAQMCGREFWIKNVERVLNGHRGWEPMPDRLPLIFTTRSLYGWTGANPVLGFKTGHGIHGRTGIIQQESTYDIPYWGTTKDIYDTFLLQS